jgi:LysM repeat protein
MASSRFCTIRNLLIILLIFVNIDPAHPVIAQGDAASELMNLINELRAGLGLAPYTVDPELMALAQAHSTYQASIHTSTHQHSDGQDPPDLGVVENVAGGDIGYLEPQAAVYEIWADPVHMRTMVGYAAGSMGVGIADDGITVYYTLEVRPAETAAKIPDPSALVTTPVPLTSVPFVSLVTITPRSDGTIVHVVGYGQTLWAIALAYGVRIEQLRAWNNIPDGSNDIFAGQMLLVRPANLAPSTPTGDPGTMPEDSSPGPTLLNSSESEKTPSSPTQTVTTPDLAGAHPTSAETLVGNPSSISNPVSDTVSFIPVFAGISILVGCVLLAILFVPRKPA